jgi:hypothetical protein
MKATAAMAPGREKKSTSGSTTALPSVLGGATASGSGPSSEVTMPTTISPAIIQ